MVYLPQFRASAPNVKNFFQPVQNALTDYRHGLERQVQRNDRLEQQEYQRQQEMIQQATNNQRYEDTKAHRAQQIGMKQQRFGLQKQQYGLQNERLTDERKARRLKSAGQIVSFIEGVEDPAQKQGLYERFIASDPDLASNVQGLPMDQGLAFVKARSGVGGSDPLTQATIELKRAQAEKARRLPVGGHALTQATIELKRAQAEKERALASGASQTEVQQRHQQAVQYGIDPNSEEGRAYILTGKLSSGGANLPGGFKDQKQVFDVESGYRKEFSGITKSFGEVSTAFEKVKSSAANPSAAGDLSLIFNFMKMLDPGSVVREGEFATAQNAAGVPERIRNIYARLMSGERLSPDQRADFAAQAGNVFKAANVGYQTKLNKMREIAEGSGIDPNRAIPDYYEQSAPPAGSVMVYDPATGELRPK
jgi:hypothetical protein